MLANEIEGRIGSFQSAAGARVSQVRRGAMQAAETTGKVLITMCAALVLGLGAAVGGAILSVRRERREHVHVHLPRATTYASPTTPRVS